MTPDGAIYFIGGENSDNVYIFGDPNCASFKAMGEPGNLLATGGGGASIIGTPNLASLNKSVSVGNTGGSIA